MFKSKRLIVVLVVVFSVVVGLGLNTASAGNPFGLIVKKLNRIISLLENEVIPKLDPRDVPKTGQTTSYATGDDGDLQMGRPWPEPRFTDNGDGTVTDNLTGLTWLKDGGCFTRMTWQEVLDTIVDFNANPGNYSCEGYTAIYNDWRLPNLKELQSLVHYGYTRPALPDSAGTGQFTQGDPFLRVDGDYYWSSTTMADDPHAARVMNLWIGIDYEYDKTYVRPAAWCVRGPDDVN